MGVTDELPRGEDVARVRAQLALGGVGHWPIRTPRSSLRAGSSRSGGQSSARPSSSSMRASLAASGPSAPYSVGT
jgi:hypothetical protein